MSSWMLQPHNWGQAMQKNLYNVAYRRTATYKGFGALGQGQCPGDPGCPGYVAPGSVDYQTSLLQEILTNQSTATPAPAAATINWTPYLILGGGLLLVMMASRR